MGRRPRLANLPISVLELELRRRDGLVRRLQQRHRAVLLKADRLADQIRELGGEPGARRKGRRGGPRPRNGATLVDSLAKVLDGKTMSVTEVAEAVQKAGYRTSSSHFRTQVNIALSKSGKFKRVGRGQYTAKG
jgi:hypothetical protein